MSRIPKYKTVILITKMLTPDMLTLGTTLESDLPFPIPFPCWVKNARVWYGSIAASMHSVLTQDVI